MNPAEFANMARAEKRFWWYEGMHRILTTLLDPHIGARGIKRGMDAGCGTGHLAKLLEQRYEFPIFPADRAREGVDLARRAGLRRLSQCDAAALPFPNGS